jgi:Uma2 family endonuclease
MSTTEVLKPPAPFLLDSFPPDTRVVVAGVSWDDYESLMEAFGERGSYRVAFDGKDIEMMTLGPVHERQKAGLELFITIVAGELKIRRQPVGSATWRRKALERAIESDLGGSVARMGAE